MSGRAGGFRIGDLDVGFLDDTKVRTLVRSTRDEGLVARCLVAYVATIADSWGSGDRVSVRDAAPVWLTALDDLEERLRAAQLLDDEGRIPEHAWQGWFGPAAQRRDERVIEGAIGGLMARHPGTSRRDAELTVQQRIDQGTLKLPSGRLKSALTRSVPSCPSVSSVQGSTAPVPLPTETPYTASAGKRRNGLGNHGDVDHLKCTCTPPGHVATCAVAMAGTPA